MHTVFKEYTILLLLCGATSYYARTNYNYRCLHMNGGSLQLVNTRYVGTKFVLIIGSKAKRRVFDIIKLFYFIHLFLGSALSV